MLGPNHKGFSYEILPVGERLAPVPLELCGSHCSRGSGIGMLGIVTRLDGR